MTNLSADAEPLNCVAVVVHYGDPRRTIALVDSLVAAGLHAIVVANDRSVRPESLSKAARWAVPPANLGYAGAFCYAIDAEPEADEYWLLNNDIILPEAVIWHCSSFMRDNPKVGVCGPALHNEDGLQHGPGTLTKLLKLPTWRSTFEDVTDCEWVTGAVMLIRGEVARAFPMYRGYFLGCEDVDFCQDLRRAGYGIVYLGNQAAWHEGGQIIGSWWYYYASRNRIWFARRHRSIWVWLLTSAQRLLLAFRIVTADAVKGRGFTRTHFWLRGLVDGLKTPPQPSAPPWPAEPVPLRLGISTSHRQEAAL